MFGIKNILNEYKNVRLIRRNVNDGRAKNLTEKNYLKIFITESDILLFLLTYLLLLI